MRRGVIFSATLHVALALLLVAGTRLFPGQSPQAPPVLAEVELVVQDTPAVGSAAALAASSAHAAAEPVAAPAQPSHPSSPAIREVVAADTPVSSAPSEPSTRLREPGSQGTGLVSGSRVIPAALDWKVRNVPPAYPPGAVREGQQGFVILRVHISADGTGTGVDIFRSSGYGLLDQAAERAVGHWHFVPAREAGQPISSTMLLKIRFVLTNLEGGQ